MLAIRLALGTLFLISGLIKLRRPYDFLPAIYGYEMLGPTPALALAVILPALEVVLGLCLVLDLWTPAALASLAFLSLLFVTAQAWAFYQRLDIPCGCFLTSSEKVSYVTLLRAVAILAASLLALTFHFRSTSLPSTSPTPPFSPV